MSKGSKNRMGCFNLCHGRYVTSVTFKINNFSQLETTVMSNYKKGGALHDIRKLEKLTKPLKYMKIKVVTDVTLLRVENIEC